LIKTAKDVSPFLEMGTAEMVTAVIYRGVQYTVTATAEPDIWQWRFRIGDAVKTGRIQTRLAALAARRARSKIDAVLKELGSSPISASDNREPGPDA
jgi:hypothetical protein